MYKIFWILILIFMSSEVIAGTCYVSGTNISFGKYTRTDPNLDVSGTFSVRCSDNAAHTFCIRISTVQAGGGRLLTRVGGLQTLSYELYSNSFGGTIWQNDIPGQTCYTAICPYNTSSCNYTIYGRIGTGQNKPAGTYQEQIDVWLDINPAHVITYAQAYITNGCSIATDTFNFGVYSADANDDVSPVNLHVNCNLAGPGTYTITLSAGNSGNTGDRYMIDGSGHNLYYNLYTDSTRTVIWTTSGSFLPPAGGGNTNFTVWGRIPSGIVDSRNMLAPPGSYRDVITATVTY